MTTQTEALSVEDTLKLALEALIVSLPDLKGCWKIKAEDAITAIEADHGIGKPA